MKQHGNQVKNRSNTVHGQNGAALGKETGRPDDATADGSRGSDMVADTAHDPMVDEVAETGDTGLEEGTDVVTLLGELGDGAIITEQGLAKLFGRHPTSVKRAVERGELPPPVHLMKRPVFTAGVIRSHLFRRLEAAAWERIELENTLAKHRPGPS